MKIRKNLLPLTLTVLLSGSFISSTQAITPSKMGREHGGWYIDVEGFDIRATDTFLTNFPYAVTNSVVGTFSPLNPSTIATTQRIHHFDPDYDWGYRVALGYDIPSCNPCNYGFSLEYTHFDTDENRSIGGQLNSEDEPTLTLYTGLFGDRFTDVNAHLRTRFNTVDLLGHQNLTVCNCVDIQFFAGARYVNLRENYHDHLFIPEDVAQRLLSESITVSENTINFDNKFDGAGPRVGFNTFYQVACGFGLTVEAAGNLLFGCSRSNYSEVATTRASSFFTPGVINTFIGDHHHNSPTVSHVVPGLSGKIGLAYRALFSNCSSLVIEGGYRGDKYFGLSDMNAFTQSIDHTDGINLNSIYHNFDLSGPYLSLTFHA